MEQQCIWLHTGVKRSETRPNLAVEITAFRRGVAEAFDLLGLHTA